MHGSAVVRAVVTERVSQGTVFAPIHWSGQNSSAGRIGAVVHALVDPISGQPDSKATPVRISTVEVQYSGYAITGGIETPQDLSSEDIVYWSCYAVQNGVVTSFAVDGSAASARSIAEALLPAGERLSFVDDAEGQLRIGVISNGCLTSIVVLSRAAQPPPSEWLKSMLLKPHLTNSERRGLLAGRMPDVEASDGPIVCVCYQVSAPSVEAAIASGCASTDAIGNACRAGTNCGSCLPEIHRMLRAALTVAKSPAIAADGDEKSGVAFNALNRAAV
jgi:assimilatory nitrate reductase catalytic subunit